MTLHSHTLRVVLLALISPLSLFLSSGSAVRRDDGIGGWPPSVYSSSKCSSRESLAFGASGVMPFSSSPSTRPGSVRCSPGSFRACRPWRTGADRSGSGRSSPSPISLLSSLIWRATICCCLLFQAIMGVDEEQGRCRNLKPAYRVCAYQ